MSTRQLNLRVPDAARDILSRVAVRLKENEALIPRLEAWLAGLDEDAPALSVTERLEALERRLEALEGGNPTGNPQRTPWTIGEGAGRRLTTEGEGEVKRRIEAGESDAAIAEAVGVSSNTIKARRPKPEGTTQNDPKWLDL